MTRANERCRFDVTSDQYSNVADRMTCDDEATNLVDGQPRCEKHTPTIVKIKKGHNVKREADMVQGDVFQSPNGNLFLGNVDFRRSEMKEFIVPRNEDCEYTVVGQLNPWGTKHD